MSAADLVPAMGEGALSVRSGRISETLLDNLSSFHYVDDLIVISNALTYQPRLHMVWRVMR
jgi:hypothetical protein